MTRRVPLPFVLPPPRYTADDQPWCHDASPEEEALDAEAATAQEQWHWQDADGDGRSALEGGWWGGIRGKRRRDDGEQGGRRRRRKLWLDVDEAAAGDGVICIF